MCELHDLHLNKEFYTELEDEKHGKNQDLNIKDSQFTLSSLLLCLLSSAVKNSAPQEGMYTDGTNSQFYRESKAIWIINMFSVLHWESYLHNMTP